MDSSQKMPLYMLTPMLQEPKTNEASLLVFNLPLLPLRLLGVYPMLRTLKSPSTTESNCNRPLSTRVTRCWLFFNRSGYSVFQIGDWRQTGYNVYRMATFRRKMSKICFFYKIINLN